MNVLSYVNAKIGTYNEPRYSHGNILPLVSRPFGMASFTIQNDGGLAPWFYNPYSHSFEGIRLTHQPSPWIGDFGHLLFLPFTNELNKDRNRRWTSFRPEETILKPHLFSTYLQRYNVYFKLTTSERGAIFSIKSKYGENVNLAIMTFGESHFEVKDGKLIGETTTLTFEGKKKITQYFCFSFNKELINYSALENGGIALYFNSDDVEISFACSFISIEQAMINFDNELINHNFKSLFLEAKKAWEEKLNLIEISNENLKRKKTFYSCMYRAFLFPQKFYEVNGDKILHYNLDIDEVREGYYYTNNGFWDTYRTVYPFLSMVAPGIVKEIVESYIIFAEETGHLPKWLSAYDVGMMPGTLVEATISDACVRGIIKDDLLNRAYKVLIREVFDINPNKIHGRKGNHEHVKLGYVSTNLHESINSTCDYSYCDFCVAQVSKLVGDMGNYEILMKRSKNYAHLFDPQTGFLRGKDANGNFAMTFNPYEWGGNNCEGSSWQNSFAVYHDIDGLAELHGGKEKLIKKLDELFAADPKYTVGYYDNEIHEMSEMSSVDFGQCAISNQPSFHIPWLYSYLGEKEKTEYWIEKIVDKLFSYKETGFPGDEDNGTMACWYIFACLGFYPLCPGKLEYVKSKKLFNKIKICGKEI